MADFDGLNESLTARKSQHLYRTRRVLSSAQKPEQEVNGRQVLSFCSNDYLGLANDPEVKSAFISATEEFGVGSGASHLVNGHSELHHQLELALAEFTGRDRAVLFSTGYMANLGAISALVGKGDTILQDRWNHASLIDAGLSCGARFKRYQHNDMSSLEQRLCGAKGGRTLIVTDGVFSMDGDLAPLDQVANLADQYNACLMVDDAHGLGVLGTAGAGCAEHFQLNQQQLPVLMGTLGKAFGTFGAFIAGSESMVETMIQQARTYIYTTALPPAVAAATLVSIERIKQDQWRRDQLLRLTERFREGASRIGFTLMPSHTPIQPILVGSERLALDLSQALEDRGLLITAIRPPTVPKGTARLRVTFSAAHSELQLERLLNGLSDVYQALSDRDRDSLARAADCFSDHL